MFLRVRCLTLALSSALLIPTTALGSTILVAQLTTNQEPGNIVPTLSTGGLRPVPFGDATFILSDDLTSLSFVANIYNIDVTGTQTADPNDNLTAAHIHAGTAIPPATNPVVWGFFGSPYNDNNPDNSPNPQHVVPFATGVGGTFSGTWNWSPGCVTPAPSNTFPSPPTFCEGNNTTLALQLANILNNRAYINFHTVQFGGGEIRGLITPMPEPATVGLVGIGVLGLVWRRSRALRARR